MNPFEAMGIWWLPSQPEFRFEAKLEYFHTQQATLSPTTESFWELFMKRNGRKVGSGVSIAVGGAMHIEPIIVGVAEGRQFSLLHCQLHGFGSVVGLIIEGMHFAGIEDAKFSAYSIGYSGLDEWGVSGQLSGSIEEIENGSKIIQISYKTKPLAEKPLTVELQSAFLEISHSINFPSSISNQACLTEKTDFRVIAKTDLPLSATEFVDKYSNLLRNFLMIATWNYVAPLYCRAWNDKSDIGKGQGILYWIGKGIGLKIPQYSGDWLFTMLDLEDELSAVFQRWEENYEIFSPFIHNFFAHRYLSETFVEVQFLSYMQALEAYSKRRGYPKKMMGLFDSMKSNHLVGKIVNNDVNHFVRACVDIRNDLTHDTELKITLLELEQYTRKLELLILLTIYTVLGFPEDLIHKIAARNVGFQQRLRY